MVNLEKTGSIAAGEIHAHASEDNWSDVHSFDIGLLLREFHYVREVFFARDCTDGKHAQLLGSR